MNPLGPGALEEPKLERAWITSLFRGMEQRLRVSFSKMIGEKRSSISSAMGGLVEENRLVKWETGSLQW